MEDLLFERGIDICHETVRLWWNRFGPLFAADIRRQRMRRQQGARHWRWHLDEMFVRLNGEMVYLWRAVDHEGEVLESYVTKTRDKSAALRFIRKALKRHGQTAEIVTDGLRSYSAALKELNAGLRRRCRHRRWRPSRAFAPLEPLVEFAQCIVQHCDMEHVALLPNQVPRVKPGHSGAGDGHQAQPTRLLQVAQLAPGPGVGQRAVEQGQVT